MIINREVRLLRLIILDLMINNRKNASPTINNLGSYD